MSDSGRAGVGANTLVPSEQDEWLEADGLGGFASGTTLGLNTRRYHALLLVAVEPPAARHVLVNDAVVWLEHGGGSGWSYRATVSAPARQQGSQDWLRQRRSASWPNRGLASSVS